MTVPGTLQAVFAAPASLVTAKKAPKSAGGVVAQDYGMTMWFSVRLAMPGGDLGLWSGCAGLDVQFSSETVKVGGQYDRPTVLPGALTYGNVTLERAMTATDSKKVRDWLSHVASTWINAPEGGAPEPASGGGGRFHPGTSVRIELFHRLDEPAVASWNLRDVVPVSWSAPTLSTSGGAVAIEKLVLAHGGFLGNDSSSGSPWVAGKAKLVLSDHYGNSFSFPYAPDSVYVHRQSTVGTGDRQDREAYDVQISSLARWQLRYQGLVVEGVRAVAEITELLRTWTTPDPPGSTVPRVVVVRLGSGGNPLLSRRSVLSDVKIDYTRFTGSGTPNRATVSFDCHGVLAAPDGPSSTARGRAATQGDDDLLRPRIGRRGR